MDRNIDELSESSSFQVPNTYPFIVRYNHIRLNESYSEIPLFVRLTNYCTLS